MGCTRVSVTPSGNGVTAAPKPLGCTMEFLRTKAPDRPYDELASIDFQGSNFHSATDAQKYVREEACKLGADAVLITREFVPGSMKRTSMMSATAVKYRPAAASTGIP